MKAALGLNLDGLAMAGCLRCLGNLAKGDPSGKTSHGLASDPALMRDVVQLMGGQDQRCSFEACNLLVLLVDSNAETFSTLVPTVEFQHGGVKLLTGVLDFFTNMEDERLKGYSTLEGSVCGICRAVHHFLSSGLESILNVMDDRGEGKGSELPYSDLVFLIQACASLVSTFPHMWMAAMFAVRSMTIVAKIAPTIALQTDAVQSCVNVLQAHPARKEVILVVVDLLTSVARSSVEGKMQTLQHGGSKAMATYLSKQSSFVSKSLTTHSEIFHKNHRQEINVLMAKEWGELSIE